MHLDPAFSTIVSALLAILLVGILLHRLKQPHVVGYLVTGIILGPGVIGLISAQALIERLGAMGVVFLIGHKKPALIAIRAGFQRYVYA